MADNQVHQTNNLALKIFPKTGERAPEQQKTACQEDQLWSQILQEYWFGLQDSQISY